VPVVLADHAVAGVDTDFVGLDHEATGYLATRHLIELGHRRIACVAGPLHEPSGSARLAGCRRALAEAGLALDPSLLVHGSADCQGGHDAARSLLGLDAPPSALFACNDLMALGALCAAREAGVEVPGALSVVGGDDLGVAAFAMPRLTTVAQPSHEMGRQLTELLLQRIHGDALPRRHARLQGSLVVRHSSAAPQPR
jgi:LacI family transcriptional regulator